jgi:hypothetical protein
MAQHSGQYALKPEVLQVTQVYPTYKSPQHKCIDGSIGACAGAYSKLHHCSDASRPRVYDCTRQ